jgi:beta-lactamase class D
MLKSLALVALLVSGCAEITPEQAQKFEPKAYFPNMKGCFLLYNVKSGITDRIIGDEYCKEQLVACSSFKVPLALMAFDSGVLKNTSDKMKWDGVKRDREVLNQDHNAQTWMRDSVVWYSQKIATKLGKKKFQKYLDSFNYGNKDLRGGLTQAWLHAPSSNSPALKISAYEQLDFMTAFWAETIPVSKEAIKLTKEITYLETSPKGFALNGKTGSNYFNNDQGMRLGWFIGHIQKGDQEFITITNFRDITSLKGAGYGGLKARDITKEILTDMGYW